MSSTPLTRNTVLLLLVSLAVLVSADTYDSTTFDLTNVDPTNTDSITASTLATITSTSSSSKTSSNSSPTSYNPSTTTASPDPSCSIVNNVIVPGNFTLDVSSDVLRSNTVYTVTISGFGNATVILQAKAGAAFVGQWSSGNSMCSGGSPLFNISLDASTKLVVQWTSPNNLSPVDISAFIKVNDTSKLTKTLTAAQTTAPTTTKNAGIVNKPMLCCFDVTRSLIVLMVITKLL